MFLGYVLSGCAKIPGRRALSPVMRVRARSTEAPVSRVQFDTPKKALVVAAPVLLVSSAESVVSTAVSVQISIDGVLAAEDAN